MPYSSLHYRKYVFILHIIMIMIQKTNNVKESAIILHFWNTSTCFDYENTDVQLFKYSNSITASLLVYFIQCAM